jgi:hypothetical protein
MLQGLARYESNPGKANCRTDYGSEPEAFHALHNTKHESCQRYQREEGLTETRFDLDKGEIVEAKSAGELKQAESSRP